MDKTTTVARLDSPTGLYWSERGAVGCERHIPYPGSDTWRWERWRFLAVDEAEAWRSELGDLPSCETCGKVAALPPF